LRLNTYPYGSLAIQNIAIELVTYQSTTLTIQKELSTLTYRQL